MSDEKKLTTRAADFSAWYNELVLRAVGDPNASMGGDGSSVGGMSSAGTSTMGGVSGGGMTNGGVAGTAVGGSANMGGTAMAGSGNMGGVSGSGMMGGGTMGGGGRDLDLKKLEPNMQVKAITYCHDTYRVTTADGKTRAFWERNLRLKTDSGKEGPLTGAPALVPAGMMGDRADVIFAAPDEISKTIEPRC